MEGITVTQILTVLSSIIGSGFVIWWQKYNNREKTKAEIGQIISEQWKQLNERLNEERRDLEERIETYERTIEELKKSEESLRRLSMKHDKSNREHQKLINILTFDSETCKYQHSITELELKLIKKYNKIETFKTEAVYLLDDDSDVVDEFKHKFIKTSVLNFIAFTQVMKFMTHVKKDKPPIVIIDYRLDAGMTAEDIIYNFGYEPDIFIMSVNSKYEERFVGKPVKFFTKDAHYIHKIAQEIVRHLIDKN